MLKSLASCSIRPFTGLLSVALIVSIGCSEDLSIRKYKVAKQDSQRGTASSMAAAAGGQSAVAQDQQMLGAIVPHSQSAWFFKLQGDPTLVLKNRDEFRQIVDSVKFKATGEPSWELAKGWEDQVMGGGITYATLTKPQDGLTATVTMLGTDANSDAGMWQKYVLENVNRWRRQLELGSESWDALESDLEEVEELSDGPAKAYFVSLVGKSSGDSFRPPFMSSAMSGNDLPSGPPETSPNAGTAPAVNSAVNAEDPGTASEVSFDIPPDWTEVSVSASQMRKAAFEIESDEAQAEVTVIAAGGDIRANLRMWFGQVALDPTEEAVEQVLTGAEAVDVNGQTSNVYWLDGSQAPGETSILIADVPWKAGESLFVKLKGDARLVENQKENFEAFLKSLTWK